MNYNITIGLVSVIFITSCSYNPFKSDTKPQKTLVYQFDQPKRQQLASNQAAQLGNPLSRNFNSNGQTYYSANGHLCRTLSSQRTACFINNRWYMSRPIMTINR